MYRSKLDKVAGAIASFIMGFIVCAVVFCLGPMMAIERHVTTETSNIVFIGMITLCTFAGIVSACGSWSDEDF